MKKILIILSLVISLLFPVNALAAGSISVSPATLTIEVGSSSSFYITAYNTIGDVTISSNNSSVASVSTGEWGTGMIEENQTKYGTITVYGNSIGTATITLNIDAATFDGEDLSGQTRTITVNVVAKSTTPSNNSNNTNTNTNTNVNTNTNKVQKSTNNKLKSLTVEGYNLEKIDDNNYKLEVKNDITKIIINAECEDSKATLSGNGEHELNIGENNIEVIVKSESGLENKINVQIIRKDGYYLDDLDDVLQSDEQEISIILGDTTSINQEVLNKIKDSKKVVTLNKFDENKNLLYSWSIDGSKLNKIIEFNTNVTFVSDNSEKINNLANYASGKYINFEHDGKLSKGIKIKANVSDKFVDGDKVNVYYFNENENKLELKNAGLVVSAGCIEFEIEHASEYLVTKATLSENKSSNEVKYLAVLVIIETVFLGLFIILDINNINLFCKKKSGIKCNSFDK